VAARAFEAAAQAKKASLFVAALNECRPVAPYDLCRDDIALLGERLAAVQRAAAQAVDHAPAIVESPAGAWLWRRLNSVSVWHLGVGLGTLDAHLRA
jgi:hypothetical protein